MLLNLTPMAPLNLADIVRVIGMETYSAMYFATYEIIPQDCCDEYQLWKNWAMTRLPQSQKISWKEYGK